MQLASLAYAKGAFTLLSLNYDYLNAVPGNNGQIQRITDTVDSTRTTTFTYDAWLRLKQASNTQWTVTETYDRYGNRNAQSAPVSFSSTADPTTNRLPAPYVYDAAGNMTNDGSNTLAYDGENRIISSTSGAASGTYTFDGNGLRVKRVSGSTTTVYIFSGSKVVAEYDNGAAVASPSREYIYSGAELVATLSGASTTYHHADHLSNRVSTDSTGTAVRAFGHFPFGESWYETGTASKLKFTSYERDSESGNDYAIARSYVNRLARFSSPDPLGGSIGNPQSLNRYGYALSDPANLSDPSGNSPHRVLYYDGDGNLAGGDGGGGYCTIDGFEADCGIVNGALASGAAVALPPGMSQSGFINGNFYYLTADNDPDDDGLIDFNYPGLTAGQIEILGLPTVVGEDMGWPPDWRRSALKQGLDAAKELLKKDRCAKFFGGNGPATLDATEYMFENLKDPKIGASTNSVSSVFINTTGPFLDFSGPMRAFGISWTQQSIRPLILLHELGHQLSDITGFKPDAGNHDLNRAQSQKLVDNCFK
jgi:RHS repeat-associated protein